MLAQHKQLADAKDAAAEDAGGWGCRRLRTPVAKELLQRQIDRLVYELYGLTEEQIGIVEGRTP